MKCQPPTIKLIRWRLLCILQFDSGQFLPVSDENIIRHSQPQTQPAAHSTVSAFTLVTANSLEDLWHVRVFIWTVACGHLYFRNPSCGSSGAHLPQALSPPPLSLHPPLPPETLAVPLLGAARLGQDKASPQTWWPPAGSHAGAGGRFPGSRGSGRSHPPEAAWDPRPPPTGGWVWPGPWWTPGRTGRPPAPRPRCRHGCRWRAVSPEQSGGGKWGSRGQSVVQQERWSWKRSGGYREWEVEWQRSYLRKCIVYRHPAQPHQLRHRFLCQPSLRMTFYASAHHTSLLHLKYCPSYHLSIASLCSLRLRSFDHLSLQDRTEGQEIERGRERGGSSFLLFFVSRLKTTNM